MLLGITGKLQSGKDSTFKIIKELKPEAEKISFAEKLKESAAAVLNIDLESLEYLKNEEKIRYTPMVIGWGGGPLPYKSRSFNIREFLQRYGTEAHRNIFGEDFWVDQSLPDNLDHENRFLVVTDMRFPNEVDRVIELGGYTVRVNRVTETAHGDHDSEQDIADELIDWDLDNTGTPEQLKIYVKEMLTEFGITI